MAPPEPGSLPDGRAVDDIVADVAGRAILRPRLAGGRAFSLVYFADDPELSRLQHQIAQMFLHENALNPFRYATLLRMEGEIVAMATSLFGASHGSLSSGGTESIFLAVQTARDDATARGIAEPEIVCSDTAHPAFAKACHYLGVDPARRPGRT